MELLFGIIVGLVILVMLVVVHELGHAIVARRNGVVVEEFGIGFPPKAWAKKLKNGILFSVNWLPLGGFVKLQGEHDSASKKGDYGAASFWQKTKILFAGVVMNWVVAAVLLTVLAVTGLPKILPNQFSVPGDATVVTEPVTLAAVDKGSAAEKAGLEVGDKITRFGNTSIDTSQALIDATRSNKGKTVDVVYNRNGETAKTSVTLRSSNEDGKGYLGVGSGQATTIKSTWSAPVVGVVLTGQLSVATVQALGSLVGNLSTGLVSQLSGSESVRKEGGKEISAAGQSVSGPIGILGVIFPAAQQAGFQTLVLLTAIISLSLAVMNVLPIPALDGGRWYTMALFRIFRKNLTKEREEKIQATGFLILMALVVVVTFADVSKLIK